MNENQNNNNLEIMLKLIGYIGKHNHEKTIQTDYRHIEAVLKEYNITAIEGAKIVLERSGAVSPLWNKNVIPFIIASLKDLHELNKQLTEPQQSIKEPESIDSKEPEHKYPKIFKNGYAYQMFIELKNLTVDKNPLADYGFIYYKLKNKKIGAIDKAVTHPIFIDFLKKEFDADISAKKFTFKNQQNKQQTYNTVFEKYKANIID